MNGRNKPATARRNWATKSKRDGKTVGLLVHSAGQAWAPFTCLNSLRDVEPEVRLIHDDHDMEERVMAEPALEDIDRGA